MEAFRDASTVLNPLNPVTFVTGQVLFGLTAAYQKFGEDRIRMSAVRAGDFLLSCLTADGRFAVASGQRARAGLLGYFRRSHGCGQPYWVKS
jgi:hypothetical protein